MTAVIRPPTELELSNAWQVLRIFILPIGAGIPGGVLRAKELGYSWPMMTALYFLSDLLLALVFEPVMLLVIAISKRSERVARFRQVLRLSMERTTRDYGTRLGPFALVMIAFGVDPMTGRAAAAANGHGFLSGWMLAIMGDMIFFSILMISTLWLNSILGDGTWTTLIILALMFIIPPLVRRFRERNRGQTSSDPLKTE